MLLILKVLLVIFLAILADEGKLNWDDKVTKFLPDFKMYDDYVTQELTIKDLVTHRAGLGLGQGDLMFFRRWNHDYRNYCTMFVILNLRILSEIQWIITM